MRLEALCVVGLASCSFPETKLTGPNLDGARALVVLTVPPEGEPTAWAFEPPLGAPQLVPSAAPAELYALQSGCPLSVLNLAPGKVEITRGAGAALPEVDRYHHWLGADAEDLPPIPWTDLESRTPIEALHFAEPGKDWCIEAERTTRRTVDLSGPDPMAPLRSVNPAFGVQLDEGRALVGLLGDTINAGAYFQITDEGPEQLDLGLPRPRGAFAAADGETWIVAGDQRQLYRGRVETGFTVAGSTRAVAVEPFNVWMDGPPDGSELFVLGKDGVAEHYQNGRWTRLATLVPSLSYYWGSVLWLGLGEALFTTGLDGGLAHVKDGILRTIRPPSADALVSLSRHPSLGILVGTEAGAIQRLTLPNSWDPIGPSALPDSIAAIAPLGDGFVASGVDNGLVVYHPRIGFCKMGAVSEARPILRLGTSVLLVHRAVELRRPVVLELFDPLPLSLECSVLR